MLGGNNVVSTLYQRCATMFRRCFNVGHRRCINVVQRWKSDVGFCFIFNVGSTLFQRWSTTLKQRWSDVEMLAGRVLNKFTIFTGKHLCWSLFLKRHCSFVKETLQYSCFPMNIAKYLKEKLFLQNTSGGCFWKVLFWFKKENFIA